MEKINVIVPVYKVEPYLHRCVDSILGQSYENFELILVDDGSPDSCGAICDAYAEKDSRILVIHQKNGGLSAARNAGIDWAFANSDSQWLAFIDSDDWVHRDYLKILLSSVHAYHTKMAVCDMTRTGEYMDDSELCEIKSCCLDAEKAYTDYYGMCLAAWRKLYHRDLFENLRFPVGKLHEDCYITHLPLFAAGKVAVCDVPLYYYYTNPGSITRVRWKPKRLEEIDAHELRLGYLQEHGYSAAYRRELEVYADTLMEQSVILMDLQKEDQTCASYLAQLQQKLRQVLKQEKATGKLTFDQGRLWAYLMAYPVEPLYRVLRKLQKIKHSA